jgi:hypothetical protein
MAQKTSGKRTQRASQPTRSRAPRAAATPVPSIPPALVEAFGTERIALVRARYPRAPEDAIARLLYAADRLGLDPLTDLYPTEGRGRDGAESEWSIAAKRDALLKVANRRSDYRGMDADVLRAEDTFRRVAPDPASPSLRARAGVEHTYGLPSQRGDIIGAWSAVEVANADGSLRPPTFFIAELTDYQPDPESLADGDPWKEQVAACIVKAAQLWTLRIGLGLEDLVGEQEAARRVPAEPARPLGEALVDDEPSDPLDARILDLFREGQQLDPTMWPLPMVQARTLGANAEARTALADEMDASFAPLRASAHGQNGGPA